MHTGQTTLGTRPQVSLQPGLSRLLRPRITVRRFSCSMASRTPADNSDGRLETFLEATNGSVWNIRQTIPHSGPWSQVNSLGGIVRASVRVALNSDGRLQSWDPNGQRRLQQLADRAARRTMEWLEQAHPRTAVAAPTLPRPAGRAGTRRPGRPQQVRLVRDGAVASRQG